MEGNRSNTWSTKAAKSCKNSCSTWGILAHTSYAPSRATKHSSTDVHRTCILFISEVFRKHQCTHSCHLTMYISEHSQCMWGVSLSQFTKCSFFNQECLAFHICLPNYFWQGGDNLGAELLKKTWGQTHGASVKEQHLSPRDSINSKPFPSLLTSLCYS